MKINDIVAESWSPDKEYPDTEQGAIECFTDISEYKPNEVTKVYPDPYTSYVWAIHTNTKRYGPQKHVVWINEKDFATDDSSGEEDFRVNESTTSGSIATVAAPMTTQSRNASIYGGKKGGNLLIGKKTNKKYANSISEGKMKELAIDIRDMDNGNFKKKYGKSKEQLKFTLGDPQSKKTVHEAQLEEEDKLVDPKKGHKRKTGLHGKDEEEKLSHFKHPFKSSGDFVSDSRGNKVCDCDNEDLAKELVKALNAYVRKDESMYTGNQNYKGGGRYVSQGTARSAWKNLKHFVEMPESVSGHVEDLDAFFGITNVAESIDNIGAYTTNTGGTLKLVRNTNDPKHLMLVNQKGEVVKSHHGDVEDFHQQLRKDGLKGAYKNVNEGAGEKIKYANPAQLKAMLNKAGLFYSGDRNDFGNNFSSKSGESYDIMPGGNSWRHYSGASGKDVESLIAHIKANKKLQNYNRQSGVTNEAQSMGAALKNTLAKAEPGSKLDNSIKSHNRHIKAGLPGTLKNAPTGYHFDKKGYCRLGEK